MSENETNPLRQPGNPDAEQADPTAELPRAPREQSDSSAQTAPSAAAPISGDPAPSAPAAPAPDAPSTPTSGAPAAPASGMPAPPAPGMPAAPARGMPAAPASGVPAAPTSGFPAAPAPAPYAPPSPWHPAAQQQPTWPGNGGYGPPQPHGYPEHVAHAGAIPHGGPPGPLPEGGAPHGPVPPGQPPIWAQQPGAHAQPARPGRAGRAVLLGVVGLVLMAGSGIAGGAVALAVRDDATTAKTFTAAPVINEADLPNIAKQVQDSVVSISTDSAGGSGVVLSADGFVLTNNHVVEGARSVRVTFADGKTATAQVVGTDPRTDLAVIKAEGVSGLEAATLGDSDAMQVGDTVLAIGSPLGLEGSVSSGIISATDRTIQTGGQEEPQNPFQQQQRQAPVSSISGLLQTDAAINPGNSGGALVNTRGEVIGINTAIATSGQSTGNIGVGFAIPSNKAKEVAEALRKGEKVSHPSLGVSVTTADGGGAVVGGVTDNSPAAKAGLQRGDVITKFGDKTISDSDDLISAVQSGKVGDQVTLAYTRNGQEQTATVTLAEAS